MAVCGLFAGLAGSLDVLGWQFRVATNDIQVSQLGFLGIAVALLGRNTAVGVLFSALFFGALVTGTSVRNLDPAVFEPALAVEPDGDHPGPGDPDGERRHPRRLPVAAAREAAPAAAPRRRRRAGMTVTAPRRAPAAEPRRSAAAGSRRPVGWAGVALAFLAFFVALPPITIRSPIPTVVLGLAGIAAASGRRVTARSGSAGAR